MKKPVKICVVGSHGSGKTTLTYVMAAHYKATGKNVKIIQETARSCPCGINDKMNLNSAIWIHNSHVNKELEAIARDFDTIISDRSAIDPLLYARHFDLGGHYLEVLMDLATSWMQTYDRIFFIRPDAPVQADGVRAVEEDFRESVDRLFLDFFENEGKHLTAKTTTLTTTQIFGDTTCWQNSMFSQPSPGASCSSASTAPILTSSETDGASFSG